MTKSGMTNDFLLNTHGGVLPKLKLPNCPQSEELEEAEAESLIRRLPMYTWWQTKDLLTLLTDSE